MLFRTANGQKMNPEKHRLIDCQPPDFVGAAALELCVVEMCRGICPLFGGQKYSSRHEESNTKKQTN